MDNVEDSSHPEMMTEKFRINVNDIAKLIKIAERTGADISEGRRLLLIAVNMGKTSRKFEAIMKYLDESRKMMEVAIETSMRNRLVELGREIECRKNKIGPDLELERIFNDTFDLLNCKKYTIVAKRLDELKKTLESEEFVSRETRVRFNDIAAGEDTDESAGDANGRTHAVAETRIISEIRNGGETRFESSTGVYGAGISKESPSPAPAPAAPPATNPDVTPSSVPSHVPVPTTSSTTSSSQAFPAPVSAPSYSAAGETQTATAKGPASPTPLPATIPNATSSAKNMQDDGWTKSSDATPKTQNTSTERTAYAHPAPASRPASEQPSDTSAQHPSPSITSGTEEKFVTLTASETVKCSVCLGKIKPGFRMIKCSCGSVCHEMCGRRNEKCPRCEVRFVSEAHD